MTGTESEWRVGSKKISGVTFYAVYQLIDKDREDHANNRTYSPGLFEEEADAVQFAKEKNEEGRR